MAATSVTNATAEPAVVKIAYTELNVGNDKWTAKRRICKSVLSEKRDTTSAFTRWEANQSHYFFRCCGWLHNVK